MEYQQAVRYLGGQGQVVGDPEEAQASLPLLGEHQLREVPLGRGV